LKSKRLQTCLISMLLLLVLTGCAEQATPVAEAHPAATQIVPTPMNSPEEVAALLNTGTGEPAEETTADTAPEPTELPTEEAQVNYCVECHGDKDMLIDTAKPEQEVISENEGAG
jgi:hypothetical protein